MLVKQVARGRTDDCGVDSMMAMIEAVLWRAAVRILDIVMIGEEFVEAPKSPKHRRHTARDYINALNTITGQPIRWTLGVETRQIGSRHAGQILRIGQLPGDEAAILLESLHCVGGETPLLALVEVSDLFGDGVPARRSTPFFPRFLISLLAVAGPVRDDFVGGAVVTGPVLGEDVPPFRLTIEQDRKSTRLNSSH